MTVLLKTLAPDTEFQHDSDFYKKGSTTWNSSAPGHPDYQGPQGSNKTTIACIPKWGGQYQPNMKIWFAEDTEVEISK